MKPANGLMKKAARMVPQEGRRPRGGGVSDGFRGAFGGG